MSAIPYPTAETLSAALSGNLQPGGSYAARCPAHDDTHASLSIGTGQDGKVLVRCHAGCEQTSIIDALKARGLWPRVNGTERDKGRKGRRIIATYDYRDEAGMLLFQVCRFDPKDFRQRRPDGTGGWLWNMQGVTAPPVYRLAEVQAAIRDGKPVLIVEGEKDANTLAVLGLTGTCNHGGAGKWRDHHSRALAGATAVYIIPDADEPGRKHARQVAASLRKVCGIEARIVEPPQGKDLSEWTEKGGNRETLLALLEQAKPAAAEPGPADWWGRLMVTKEGTPRAVFINALLPLKHDPAWAGCFGYNDFASRVELLARPPYAPPGPWTVRELEDRDILQATLWLQEQGIPITKDHALDAITTLAHERRFHPVRDYLDGLRWDGTPRLDRWLSDHMGAADTLLNRAFGSKWAIGAVARVKQPGAKTDTALILEGGQGIGKSSALAVFGGDWFSDELPDLGSKDAMLQLQGAWVMELAELTSLSRQETHRIKSFMSTSRDRFRPPYGKAARDFPRQCVFAGTINPEGGYLRDPTGARRFWTVRCGIGWEPGRRVDLNALTAVRDQLWAEAVVRYRAGESWWLEDQQLQQMQADEADARYQGDSWETAVAAYCKARLHVSVAEVLASALGVELGKQGRSEQTRVGQILTAMGWEHRRVTMDDGSRERRYLNPVQPTEVGHKVGQSQPFESNGPVQPVQPVQPISDIQQTGGTDTSTPPPETGDVGKREETGRPRRTGWTPPTESSGCSVQPTEGGWTQVGQEVGQPHSAPLYRHDPAAAQRLLDTDPTLWRDDERWRSVFGTAVGIVPGDMVWTQGGQH